MGSHPIPIIIFKVLDLPVVVVVVVALLFLLVFVLRIVRRRFQKCEIPWEM
jgi:hypothetical protein